MESKEIAKAIKDRNKVERERLAFERLQYEENKTLNERAVKANEELVNMMVSFEANMKDVNAAIEKLFKNDERFLSELVHIKLHLSSDDCK